MVKKLSEQQRIGQQGVHLLGARLLSVGMNFHPNGPLDAGIDGFLELRDPETGQVRAQWITAQLKTQKEGSLLEENDESFSYLCRQEDLDYWLSSNVPVVLFLARLSDERIVWKALHTWFADAEHRRTRKVVFDKTNDALNETALPGLAATVSNFSAPGGSSRRPAWPRCSTAICSRFLSRPRRTRRKRRRAIPKSVRRWSNDTRASAVDWILRGKRIYSFRDISMPPFRDVIEEGSEETVDTLEWSEFGRRRDPPAIRRIVEPHAQRDGARAVVVLAGRPVPVLEARQGQAQ